MADLALEVAQFEALKAAWAETPAGKLAYQKAAMLKASKAGKRSQVRRWVRSHRPYLAHDVMLPEGTPSPDEMRVRSGRHESYASIASHGRWESSCPRSGCREMRSAIGTRDLRHGASLWGHSTPNGADVCHATSRRVRLVRGYGDFLA